MHRDMIRTLSAEEVEAVAGGTQVAGYVYCHYPNEGLYSEGRGCPEEPKSATVEYINAFLRGVEQGRKGQKT